MPHKKALLLFALCLLLLAGCKGESPHSYQSTHKEGGLIQFTDDLDRMILLPKSPRRVVALSASYAETWLLSGGALVGVTSDAFKRETFTLEEEVLTIGTIKDPNSEAIIALEPDFVLLSGDIPSHLALSPLLSACAIPHAYFHVEQMEEYLSMLKICTTLTGKDDLYRTNGEQVQTRIDQVLAQHTKKEGTYLLLRSYSGKVKAKGEDIMVGRILGDLGLTNLTKLYPSLLEELSMESIVSLEPTFIVVIPMGDEGAAKATMDHMLINNPAFASLHAVKNERYHLLSKELFHYKPNNRWGESYAYLAKLITQ